MEEASLGANWIGPKQRAEKPTRTSTQVSPCGALRFSLGVSQCNSREALSVSPYLMQKSRSCRNVLMVSACPFSEHDPGLKRHLFPSLK